MDPEELMQRLALLEGKDAEREEMNMRSGFLDKYGTKFGGDADIGNVVLAELNRRGIDTARASMDAVQEVLDQLREEATAVLDKLKADTTTVSDLMDKVTTIEEGVAAASGDVPPEEPGVVPDEGMAPPMDEGMGAPPMDEGMAPEAPPPDAGMGGMPPEGADMGAPPPDAGMAPPPEAAPPPPDAGMVSDERLKNILSDSRMKTHMKSKVSEIRSRRAAPAPAAAPTSTVSDERVKSLLANMRRY